MWEYELERAEVLCKSFVTCPSALLSFVSCCFELEFLLYCGQLMSMNVSI